MGAAVDMRGGLQGGYERKSTEFASNINARRQRAYPLSSAQASIDRPGRVEITREKEGQG
jgi:hypothetical protein